MSSGLVAAARQRRARCRCLRCIEVGTATTISHVFHARRGVCLRQYFILLRGAVPSIRAVRDVRHEGYWEQPPDVVPYSGKLNLELHIILVGKWTLVYRLGRWN